MSTVPRLLIECPECHLTHEVTMRDPNFVLLDIDDGGLSFEFVCPACANRRWEVTITKYGVRMRDNGNI